MQEGFDIFNLPPATRRKERKKAEKDINKLALTFISNPTEINFERLMKRVNWGLRSFMYNILKDDSAVDECMSRTMENVYYKRDTFDEGKGHFSTWLYKIAYHNCIKYKRGEFGNDMKDVVPTDFSEIYDSYVDINDSKSENPPMDTEFIDTFDMVYENGEYKMYGRSQIISEIYDASIQCMDRLPDNLRIVMKERYINMKKVDDIAIDNKIPVTSVKNWLRKGIMALNDELKVSVPDLYKMYVDLKTEK